MFFSIKYKVFLAILLANVLLASAMFGLSLWNIKRGFIDYLNQAEAQKLEPLSQALAEEYNSQQGWDRLRNERWRWRELVTTYLLPDKNSPPDKPEDLPEGMPDQAPENSPDAMFMRGPRLHEYPHEGPPHEGLPDEGHPREGKDRDGPRGKPRLMLMFNPKVLVLDENKNIIIGRVQDKRRSEFRPILLNQQVIGYLGIQRHREFTGELEKVFVDKQQQSLAMIMVGMLLLSALMALPLAMHLVKPIRQLLEATRCLIAGKFATRISVKQKDELGLLAVDFNYLAKTLEENQTIRQQWIADISHELRTPLAVLQGEIEAMQDNIRPLNQQSLASLEQEIKQLNALVNDLHDLSVSDLGGLCYKKHDVDIAETIEAVVESFTPAMNKKNIRATVHVMARPIILADEQRLMQLFKNLMQNTLRYTNDNGELHIYIEADKKTAQIRWLDSAPGVDAAALGKLFDRFYRVENRSRNRAAGGSGLGLAICNNIVMAHNGTVEACQSALGGVEIKISLPANG